ncbi:MAG: sialate O-acetylesterase [Chlorobi bacterium]|nr:sialate O-acetylesterase [Chlorobiota bacterium]
MRKAYWKTTLFLLLIVNTGLYSQLTVASVFSDNMILQRDRKVPVWGTAGAGEKVTVVFGEQTTETMADNDGYWKAYLTPMRANTEARELKISASGENVSFKNVMVGDVWLLAGQSNMNRPVSSMGKINKEIIENADNSMVRYLKVPNETALTPQNNINAVWEVSDEKSIKSLTAIGAVFAQKIQPELNIPVGIISVNMGSTSVECWVPEEMLTKEPFLQSYEFWQNTIKNWDNGAYERYLRIQIKSAQKKHKTPPTKETMVKITETRTLPSGAYNAMLNPLFPFACKGVVWRQGEANSSRAVQYKKLLPLMIEHWRKRFENDDMPFVQISLPSYSRNDVPGKSDVAELRYIQQQIADEVRNCYFIPIIDLNDITKSGKATIHPHNKYLAGNRTARFVLGNIYKTGEHIYVPEYEKSAINGNKITISFKNTGEGLFTGILKDLKGEEIEKTNEPVNNFLIAGKNKNFVPAKARITGKNSIEVWCDNVKKPVAVRYAWQGLVTGINLYNSSKFPVSTFRTDNWKLSTENKFTPKIGIVRP